MTYAVYGHISHHFIEEFCEHEILYEPSIQSFKNFQLMEELKFRLEKANGQSSCPKHPKFVMFPSFLIQ